MPKKIILFVLSVLLIGGGCDDSQNITSGFRGFSETIEVPGDLLTIQSALDSAQNGDIVLVNDGVYRGKGNRDLNFHGKEITLKSVNGPANTIIDIDGSADKLSRGFNFENRENEKAVVDGFTITKGYGGNGGAVRCQSSSPIFKNCIFFNNKSSTSGGAVWCKISKVKFENCTFVHNSALAGDVVFVGSGATPSFDKCVIAFNNKSLAVYVRSVDLPSFKCCNIFGNSKGDWVEDIANQSSSSGNFSEDPKFCNSFGGDVTVQAVSSCLPENNSCGELIGALGSACL